MKKIILYSLIIAVWCWLMGLFVTHDPNPVNWRIDAIVGFLIMWAVSTAAILYAHFRGEDKPEPFIIYEVHDTGGTYGYYRCKEDAITKMHQVAKENNQWHSERSNLDYTYRWREEHQCYYSPLSALRVIEVEVK